MYDGPSPWTLGAKRDATEVAIVHTGADAGGMLAALDALHTTSEPHPVASSPASEATLTQTSLSVQPPRAATPPPPTRSSLSLSLSACEADVRCSVESIESAEWSNEATLGQGVQPRPRAVARSRRPPKLPVSISHPHPLPLQAHQPTPRQPRPTTTTETGFPRLARLDGARLMGMEAVTAMDTYDSTEVVPETPQETLAQLLTAETDALPLGLLVRLAVAEIQEETYVMAAMAEKWDDEVPRANAAAVKKVRTALRPLKQ